MNAPHSGRVTDCALENAIRTGDTYAAALAFRALGISTIPVKTDGSKTPAIKGWREFAQRRPTADELRDWYGTPGHHGIGATGGPASGNLAVLDFERWNEFAKWGGRLSAADREHLARCPVVQAPRGGAHLYARTAEPVRGCKLARTAAGETLIEVRGEQHFVVAPGSPAACHPTNRPYRLLRTGWLDGGPWEPMPLDVWYDITLQAAVLTQYSKPAVRAVVGDRPTGAAPCGRPGDDFNARVGWNDILTPHGWTVFRATDGATYWTRPGKPNGVSASTGFCKGESGADLFYVFSTSAAPFEAETSYSRFAVYAILNHRGDFAAATRALGRAGYGSQLPRLSPTWKGGRR